VLCQMVVTQDLWILSICINNNPWGQYQPYFSNVSNLCQTKPSLSTFDSSIKLTFLTLHISERTYLFENIFKIQLDMDI
jgi:hypothetical protein